MSVRMDRLDRDLVEVCGLKLRRCERWSGSHRGVPFSISAHGTMVTVDAPIWCLYLNLHEQMFSAEEWEDLWLPGEIGEFTPGGRKYVRHDYYSSRIIRALELHGGPTYYVQHGAELVGQRVVEVGCDYNHHGDEHPFNLEWLALDAKDAVEALYAACPGLKTRCGNCGAWEIDGEDHCRTTEAES